jgi:hypothetical protein
MRTQLFGAVGAFALAASTLVAPAVSNADDHAGIDCAGDPSACVVCGDNTFWDSGLNQCVMAGPGFADPTGPVQSGEQLDPTGPVQSGEQLDPTGPVQSGEQLIPCSITSTPAPGKPCG